MSPPFYSTPCCRCGISQCRKIGEGGIHSLSPQGARVGGAALQHGKKTVTWKEAIDKAFEESKWELDKLREYDLKARKSVHA